ncbi:hypothetical protein C8Q77DRAFT_1158940 [Trametes polyzona]|nr:hypothetical protein C8Q77DRAFT_1158940 [Trametes polyzona]
MAGPPPPAGAPPMGMGMPGFGESFGVMLLSTIIAAALYGITTLQTIFYYDRFPKDSWLLKTSVAAVWVLDTVTIVLDSHAIYYYLIVNYNNPPALLVQVWSAQVEILVTYTVVAIVQFFFIFRIYQLRPYMWYIPLVLGTIALASYAIVVVIVARVFEDSAWDHVQSPAINDPLIANWVLGMVVDFSITAVLCWYLWAEKVYVRRKTHRLLNRIIIFSINRGAIAAVVQVLTFLTKLISAQNLVWLAFHNALSKVYANAMLATRTALRGMMDDEDVMSGTELSLPTIRTGRPGGKPADQQMPTLRFASVTQASTFERPSIESEASVDYGSSKTAVVSKPQVSKVESGQAF